ncbi:MAG: hypothetical protein P8J87_05875, partial [Verrucomicrobiales bacterium]|nr:hypothetical protein [Verrucomicrobiales bacterium]
SSISSSCQNLTSPFPQHTAFSVIPRQHPAKTSRSAKFQTGIHGSIPHTNTPTANNRQQPPTTAEKMPRPA